MHLLSLGFLVVLRLFLLVEALLLWVHQFRLQLLGLLTDMDLRLFLVGPVGPLQ